MDIKKEFENPPASYRVKPFWFWNGEITKEGITEQLKAMKDQGIGGVFICARQGLTIPYLSEEWFELVRFACKEAKRFGLEVWLYDEYPYPSGMSGGEVLLEHPEAQHLFLHHKTIWASGEGKVSENLKWGRILYAKAFLVDENGNTDWNSAKDLKTSIGNLQTNKIYQESGLTAYNYKRFFSYHPQHILETQLPKGNWRIEIFTEIPYEDFKYFGSFFDPCNKSAVQSFLETTYERYRKYLGEEFTDIKGIFSDETGMQSPIPWSTLLPQAFEKRNGCSLISSMPAIFDETVPHAYKIRYELFQTIYELFRSSYHKQIADWCQKNRIFYVTEVPSMRMGMQKYSDIVGGDTAHEKLGFPLEKIYDKYLKKYRANTKAISSLTRQLDKKYAMIESFHSVGWTMTLQDAKWMIDRLGSSGINFNVFHAFYYTITDITKHDAPPSQFIQNPYWRYYKKLTDYASRMNVITTNTEADISIAVFDPVAAMWTKLGNPFYCFDYEGNSDKEKADLDKLRDDWIGICKNLLFNQLNYDHLDTEFLQEALIEDGKIKLGRATYNIVILPPCHCLEQNALKQLETFVQQGGTLISAGDLPHFAIDGNKTDEETRTKWQELFSQTNTYMDVDGQGQELIQLCKRILQSPVDIKVMSTNKKDLITCVRFDQQGNYYLFAANQGKTDARLNITLNIPAYRQIDLVHLEDASIEAVPVTEDYLTIHLEPFESRWYRFAKGNVAALSDPSEETLIIPMENSWKVQIDGKNIYRFNQLEISLNQQDWTPVKEKTFIEQCSDTKILDGEQLSFKGDFGTPKKILPNYPMTVWYRTSFQADFLPEDLSILMDKATIAGQHKIFINQQELDLGAWQEERVTDESNITAAIYNKAKLGMNEILIETTVERDEDGLRDSFYLRGSFGIGKNDIMLETPKSTLPDANWYEGFPYYSGTLTFEKKFTREELISQLNNADAKKINLRLKYEIPHYDCLEVLVNGKSLGVKAFAPYQWKITPDQLKAKTFIVTVRLTNTLSNMLEGTYFDYEKHCVTEIKP